MSKTIVVCGYGSGISDAVARRFGREGFRVAMVARSADKLAKAAASLGEAGITAKAFPCDLGDLAAVKRTFGEIRGALGPITVLHWNALGLGAGDLTGGGVDELRAVLDVSLHALIVGVQESLPDMRGQEGASILVTGGGFALAEPQVDAIIAQVGVMGLGIAKAAQHKLVGMLSAKLRGDGIYVGEVMVLGSVKGTMFDRGQATLEAATIGERFWEIHQARSEVWVRVTG
jgi:NAD(P)-dependent dehydrogenase (short-subunit alcohol dehydrogenase family)